MTEQPDATSSSDHVYALIASFLGWTLDAFDFFVLVFVVPAVATDFGKTVPDIALAITVTLAFRPVGALIFGLMADRYGRRLPLMIDLVFFSIVEVASGLAPNYTTFLILRALFGIGMGGEWGIGASLAMEKVPRRWRGLLSGLLQEGYATGYLLAACAYFFVFPTYGWRVMFFIGGAPALLAIFVRLKVKESAVWQKSKHESWSNLGRSIVGHWRLFLYLALMMTMMNFVSHGTQDMYPTFLQKQRGFTPREAAVIAMIYNVGAILAPRDGDLAAARDRGDPALGICADHDVARHWRVRAAVHGAGGLGRRPGTHQRAVTRLRSRVSARVRLSVRRPDRRHCGVHRGGLRDAVHLCQRDGAHGDHRLHARRDRREPGPREARSPFRSVGAPAQPVPC